MSWIVSVYPGLWDNTARLCISEYGCSLHTMLSHLQTTNVAHANMSTPDAQLQYHTLTVTCAAPYHASLIITMFYIRLV